MNLARGHYTHEGLLFPFHFMTPWPFYRLKIVGYVDDDEQWKRAENVGFFDEGHSQATLKRKKDLLQEKLIIHTCGVTESIRDFFLAVSGPSLNLFSIIAY